MTVELEPGKYQVAIAAKKITPEVEAFYRKSPVAGVIVSGSVALSKPKTNEQTVFVGKDRALLLVAKIAAVTVEAGQQQVVHLELLK